MSANLDNLKPGEILLEDYMKPMGLTQNALARALGVPPRSPRNGPDPRGGFGNPETMSLAHVIKGLQTNVSVKSMSNLPPLTAIRLFRDGRMSGALLGLNLQEGECEFVAVNSPFGEAEAKQAAEQAAKKLERRLKIEHLHLPRVLEGGELDNADWWKY